MKNQKHALLLLSVLVCLLSISCSQMKEAGKTLGALAEVRGEIIKKFGENDVNVHVRTFGSSTSISIAFMNSPLNHKGSEERSKRAQETAIIVKDHYADIKNISQIVVAFLKVETRFLVVTTSQGVDFFTFDNKANPNYRGGEGSTTSRTESNNMSEIPTPSYSSATDETTITTRIQLDGVPGKGLTMLLTMKVQGDTSKETPMPPKTVGFDFASFTEGAKFEAETPVKFQGDDKLIFATTGEFSAGPGTEGMTNQFAYLTIPFTKFRQLSRSKTVTLTLGEHKFALSEIQVASLRQMDEYVK